MSSSTPAERKESYKAQRKNYAKQKKRVGKELLSTFKDQSIIVLADWLKVCAIEKYFQSIPIHTFSGIDPTLII